MSDPASYTSVALGRHIAAAGSAAESFDKLWSAIWTQQRIPAELLELCRLTLARLHDYAPEIAASNALIANQPAAERRATVIAGNALDDAAFTDAEKAALLFAEYYWVDAQSITDEAADAVKAHFGEAGLVLLIEALGCIDGRIRTARCLSDISINTKTPEVAHAS